MSVVAPVAIIVFNRPDHTRQSFSVVREQQRSRLFVIADGPRPGHPTDEERCAEVRDIVADVDWPCAVQREYADSNLGLKQRVSSGLDWVFSEVDRAIVLEDDCVPHADFFMFCDALLDRYAEDERVAAVTGDNFQEGNKRGEASYYFSKYNHVWVGRVGVGRGTTTTVQFPSGTLGRAPRIGSTSFLIQQSVGTGSASSIV